MLYISIERNGTSAFGQSGLNMSKADNQPARICIVEDDPIMKNMVGDYLRQHNMRVVSASGPREMIQHLAAGELDLVILDLRLGEEGEATGIGATPLRPDG